MDRRKKIIWILTGAAILVLAAAALLVWRHRGGGGEGTTIQSTKVHPLPEAVYYLQKDEECAADPLGESRFTMGSSGCIRLSGLRIWETDTGTGCCCWEAVTMATYAWIRSTVKRRPDP